MANRTDVDAKSIHGTNPQNLIEKIVRAKIYETVYWKEHCFGLTAELVVDKAVSLQALGGVFGGVQKPTEFLCLVLKMLQIQPDKDIIIEFIRNEDYKYVRLLGAFYLRLVGRPLEVYQYLEPLYNDYRKVRLRGTDGGYILSHVDEVVDDMLHKDFLFDITLPHIPARHLLERSGQLEPRVSVLEDDFDEAALEKLESEAGAAERQAARLQDELAGAAAGDRGGEAGARDRGDRAGSSGSEDERGDRRGRDGREGREGGRRGGSSSPEREREQRKREKWRVEKGREGGRRRERDGSPRDERGRGEDYGEGQRHRDRGDRDYRNGREEKDRRERDEDRDFQPAHRDRSRERNGEVGQKHDRRDERRRRRSRSPSSSRSPRRDRNDRSRHERRDRDFDRGRDRGRDRSRSRSRGRNDRGGRGREDRRAEGRESGAGGAKAANAQDPEIAAANELRAKLGLKPLK